MKLSMFADKQLKNIKDGISKSPVEELEGMKNELEARIRVDRKKGYKHWEDADTEVLEYVSEELRNR